MLSLSLFDKIACAWMDYRQGRRITQMQKTNPELAGDFGLHKLTVGGGEMEIVMIHPAIYILAEEAAAFLTDSHADNYVQFDMMPRIDRGLRPIRFTVQWANGESPATKAVRLEKELATLRGLSGPGE